MKGGSEASVKRPRTKEEKPSAFKLLPDTIAGVNLIALGQSWDAAKNLFQHKKVEETLKSALPNAAMRLAWTIFILAAVITTLIAFLTTYESVQLSNFSSDTLSQVTGMAAQHVNLTDMIHIGMMDLILYLPLALIMAYLCEYAAFVIMKVTGGKGTFTQQFYLSSLIALSISFTTLLSLLSPLPCFPLLVIIATIILLAYFVLYVSAKEYSLVHSITFFHSLMVISIVTIARLAVTYVVMGWLSGLIGLPPMTLNFTGA